MITYAQTSRSAKARPVGLRWFGQQIQMSFRIAATSGAPAPIRSGHDQSYRRGELKR